MNLNLNLKIKNKMNGSNPGGYPIGRQMYINACRVWKQFAMPIFTRVW